MSDWLVFHGGHNLEYSAISLNTENLWNHWRILSSIWENCNEQNIFFRHSDICVKLLLRNRATVFVRNELSDELHGRRVQWLPICWRLYGMTLDEGCYYNYLLLQ